MCKFNFFFFCINILITNKNPYIRQLLLQINVWEDGKREDGAQLGGLGTNWKRVFYGKLTRTTTPKILSVSPLTTKEHPYQVKKICKAVFFIINVKVKKRI